MYGVAIKKISSCLTSSRLLKLGPYTNQVCTGSFPYISVYFIFASLNKFRDLYKHDLQALNFTKPTKMEASREINMNLRLPKH